MSRDNIIEFRPAREKLKRLLKERLRERLRQRLQEEMRRKEREAKVIPFRKRKKKDHKDEQGND
jgi:hypothetical protein